MICLRLVIILFVLPAYAINELPSADSIETDQVVSGTREAGTMIPEDRVMSDISIKDPEVNEMLRKAKRAYEEVVKPQKSMIPEEKVVIELPKIELPEIKDEVKVRKSSVKKTKKRKKKAVKRKLRNGVTLFSRPKIKHKKEVKNTITLPSGSTALGSTMVGIEVAAEKRSIDVRLDYAFLGPNEAVVELKGCVMWIEVSGSYNTERIYGVGKTISCRSPNGNTFEIPVKAHLKDKRDEYLGVKSKLLTRGKVAAAALQFLQGGTKAFGEAMAAAQTTQNVATSGAQFGPVQTQNITGNEGKFIAGRTASQAAGNFLDWWVQYYQSLSPTLAMPPGSKVFLTVEGEIQVPREFFKNPLKASEYIKKLNTQYSLGAKHE